MPARSSGGDGTGDVARPEDDFEKGEEEEEGTASEEGEPSCRGCRRLKLEWRALKTDLKASEKNSKLWKDELVRTKKAMKQLEKEHAQLKYQYAAGGAHVAPPGPADQEEEKATWHGSGKQDAPPGSCCQDCGSTFNLVHRKNTSADEDRFLCVACCGGGTFGTCAPDGEPLFQHKPPDKETEETTCPQGHPLAQVATPMDGYKCDVCHKFLPEGATVWCCGRCEYDLCEDCFKMSLLGPAGKDPGNMHRPVEKVDMNPDELIELLQLFQEQAMKEATEATADMQAQLAAQEELNWDLQEEVRLLKGELQNLYGTQTPGFGRGPKQVGKSARPRMEDFARDPGASRAFVSSGTTVPARQGAPSPGAVPSLISPGGRPRGETPSPRGGHDSLSPLRRRNVEMHEPQRSQRNSIMRARAAPSAGTIDGKLDDSYAASDRTIDEGWHSPAPSAATAPPRQQSLERSSRGGAARQRRGRPASEAAAAMKKPGWKPSQSGRLTLLEDQVKQLAAKETSAEQFGSTKSKAYPAGGNPRLGSAYPEDSQEREQRLVNAAISASITQRAAVHVNRYGSITATPMGEGQVPGYYPGGSGQACPEGGGSRPSPRGARGRAAQGLGDTAEPDQEQLKPADLMVARLARAGLCKADPAATTAPMQKRRSEIFGSSPGDMKKAPAPNPQPADINLAGGAVMSKRNELRNQLRTHRHYADAA